MTKDPDWFDNEDFWRLMSPFMFDERRWEVAEEQIEQLVEYLELEGGTKILDLPCGPGRHSLELARRGMDVTAVDRTTLYVDEARRRAAEEGLDIEFHVADMRDFERQEEFDVVINLFTSFGYFEDEAEDLRSLARFYESLRPGGHLVIDVVGKEGLAQVIQPRSWRETEDGSVLLEERTLSDDWGWIDNRWIIITPEGDRHEFHVGHRLFSAVELRKLVQRVGFVDIDISGGLDGRPYPPDSFRLVVTARKP